MSVAELSQRSLEYQLNWMEIAFRHPQDILNPICQCHNEMIALQATLQRELCKESNDLGNDLVRG
jgi:hypothetical protein